VIQDLFRRLLRFARPGSSGKMGQESSALVDDTTAPSTLKSRDLNGVASYIKSGKVKKIVVMVCKDGLPFTGNHSSYSLA